MTSAILTPRSYLDQRRAASATDASASSASSATASTQTAERDTTTEFFGKDGPSFRDVLDAINPLNHIPIVSGMLEDATGHKPSIASKLAGGALFGPIGFVASLANVIFEQQTGKGVASTMVAALSGETPSATQLASADKATTTEVASNEATATDASQPQQFASLDLKSLNAMGLVPKNASTSTPVVASTSSDSGSNQTDDKDKAVLALFGSSAAPSASRAYQKAQFLPYLKEANSQVL